MASTSLSLIAKARAEAGLTQAELAAKVGAHRKTIVRIEGGESHPRLPLAARLAKVLNLTIEELLDEVAS